MSDIIPLVNALGQPYAAFVTMHAVPKITKKLQLEASV